MEKGIASHARLPRKEFDQAWEAIKVSGQTKDRLVAHAAMALSIRPLIPFDKAPLHGLIVLAGPPGTGKTTLARGLASQVAKLVGTTSFLEVDPHALGSAAHGKSQQLVTTLFAETIPEHAGKGFLVVMLDEVEALAPARQRMSLEANPVDAHRATNAVLSGIDLLTRGHPKVLLIATTNYPEMVDPALLSRADFIEHIELPNAEARRQIILDMISVLAAQWKPLEALKNNIEKFVLASDGLDGRRLRKAIIGASAGSIETAKDPGRITAQQVIESLRASNSHPVARS